MVNQILFGVSKKRALEDNSCVQLMDLEPYSPKLYDEDFLKLKEEEVQQDFGACTVVADGHFERGRKQDNIKGV